MDPAPTAAVPVGLGSPGLSTQSPSQVSPGQQLSWPQGDENLGLGSGNPFDYKFIARLISPVAQGWLASLSEEFVVYLAAG